MPPRPRRPMTRYRPPSSVPGTKRPSSPTEEELEPARPSTTVSSSISCNCITPDSLVAVDWAYGDAVHHVLPRRLSRTIPLLQAARRTRDGTGNRRPAFHHAG